MESTYSPEDSVHAPSHPSSESPQPNPDESPPTGTPETAKLSCDNCRRRKVKCDRILPSCSLCRKLKHQCVFSTARKRPARRMKYVELEERLENMERVLVDSRRPGDHVVDAAPAPVPVDQYQYPLTPDDHSASQSQIVLSRPRSVDPCFEWDIPERGLLEQLDTTSSSIPFDHTPDPATFTRGSILIFSARGVQWIDDLVGDANFSSMVRDLKKPEGTLSQTLGLLTPPANLLPSHSLAEASVQGFFSTVNRETPMFQDGPMIAALRSHQEGTQLLGVGYIAAVNTLIAFQKHKCYPMKYKVDTDIYLQNALSLVPRLIIEGPDIMNVGAMLSIVLYMLFSSEIEIAVNLLGCVSQMMLTAGYNLEKKPDDVDGLFQQHLFWQAYLLSSDLSLLLCKAPVITESSLVCLPPERAVDGRGNLSFEDGSVMNVMHMRVALAKIQEKIHSMLYSTQALKFSHHKIYTTTIELDYELELWKAKLPGFTGKEHLNGMEGHLIYLTILHMRYYQLVIAIHSVLFTRKSGRDAHVRSKKAAPSIALCVKAARDSVSLADNFSKDHPFAKFLVPNLGWSADILCIHVLQNKNTLPAYQDLVLLEKTVKLFERFAPEFNNNILFHTTNMLYLISVYGVRRPKPAFHQPMGAWTDSPVPIIPEAPINQNLYHENLYHESYQSGPQPTGDYQLDFVSTEDITQFRAGTEQFVNQSAEMEWNVPYGFDPNLMGMSFYISNT